MSAPSVNPQHPSRDSGERDLVARVRAGDAEAYGVLYRTYYQRLCEFATYYVPSLEDADDIVSDVFAVVWETREAWRPVNVETYLFGAVRNRALNLMRDARAGARRSVLLRGEGESPGAGAPLPAPDEAIETRSERSWRLAALRRAIGTLSEQQRVVLVLRWRFQKGWEEIAHVLGISVSAAQMTHSRALSALRGRMGTGA